MKPLTGKSWSFYTAMVESIFSENLELLKYLAGKFELSGAKPYLEAKNNIFDTAVLTEGATFRAMDLVAANGHFKTMVFLHRNRNEGCTNQAFDSANKMDVELMKMLLRITTFGVTEAVMNLAVRNGRLELLKQSYKLYLISLYLDEDSIVTFKPSGQSYEHKLNGIEYFFAVYYTRGGMYFEGESVDVDRFLEAMSEALADCDFMFVDLDLDNNIAKYPSPATSKNVVTLQIEERLNESVFSINDYLPTKNIDQRMFGFAPTVDGLPIVSFKLSRAKDGFLIGYYFNHAYFDQSSIFYFLKYQSHIYTYGKDKMKLKKPELVSLDFLVSKDYQVDSIEQFKTLGEELGYYYKNATAANDQASSTPLESLVLDIYFNTEEFDKLKKQTDKYLSTNDIIHGVLLKMYSFNPSYGDDDDFCLKYNCNMRKLSNLGEESIGNIVYGDCFIVKVRDMRNKSILELAIANRECLAKLSLDGMKKETTWMHYAQHYKQNPHQFGNGKANPIACRASSWTGFDYDTISYGTAKPKQLKCPCIAQYGNINMITFEHINQKKVFVTSIYIPTDCVDSITNLGNTSNLFTSKKMD
ncbi:hypothetical protein PPL_04011 [Heterostelium album PN500]|uniref:Uncharacterized protein n=1 Tax=Heterostelium pallidum (strain ATCC 26659 / Pp 5 / PN500) TaxID=670386 RepID=D3B5S3_HETP5|nr:hypothetical protein PPL_04011 [Heterostelium album PN500]EFA83221.1 hypothetical protein PPL_04011 [Heterostelium album PN500]|eukprot:XP_020435338.1 hypothetical protein PPL_04011 [Heterostelium album PN500]